MSLESVAPLILEYRYWIVIPLTFIEGPIVAFVVGTLSSFGYFNPFVAVWIFLVKDLIVDAVFYYLGRYANNAAFVQRWFQKSGALKDGLEEVREQWATHGWRTMFISKLPHGLSPAFLATAGMVHFPLKRFWLYCGIIAVMQYGLLFALGYFLGARLGPSSTVIQKIEFVLTTLFIGGTIYYIGAWYLRRRFLQRNNGGTTP